MEWNGYDKNTLGLCYTLRCPLTCEFCCYECNPHRNEKMSIDLAKKLIKEASQSEQFSLIAFTGGEVLLFIEEIKILGNIAKEYNMPFTITTSGYWAKDFSTTLKILKDFKSLGLKTLNVSYDPSHAKFVNKNNIFNIVKAGEEINLHIQVAGIYFSLEDNTEKFLPELIDYKYTDLITSYVKNVGRASKLDLPINKYEPIENCFCYSRDHYDLLVWYDGTVYPCCSTFNTSIPNLILGNAYNMKLSELLLKAEGTLLFKTLKRQGFSKLYDILEERNYNLFKKLPNPNRIIDPCSLCSEIFKNCELSKDIKKEFEKYETNEIDSLLSSMVALIGEEKTKSFIISCTNKKEVHK
ncbi:MULTISPECIES: radical SAM protein [Psychrilyobacter]|uniref:Radical SAM protein n=1 Tax=Psychrilyobacter piezotolerans TaxID=2293438 RepID=A0ABX9KDZ8_9FUSO|nr:MULTISPECIES: radical SAM protein [Psychrilyobacter]MCS5422424.1 radical SAM protein [Psychrilyobacter sp. S5]NDI79056.1 radical SAM protein [Psychrilyobacter piezotolerans]RDE59017.1 radical SAM protein [Psychrilyobacter sp. S5]REI39594.1 radical SAM protein [Psychrilyobacter piezotolerans]